MTMQLRRREMRKRYMELAALKAAIVEGIEAVDRAVAAELVEDYHTITNTQTHILAELAKIKEWV